MKSNEHLTAPLCDFFVACWGSKIRQKNREVWEEAPAFGRKALSDVDGEPFVLLKNGYPFYGHIMYTISMLYVIQLSISNCSGLPGGFVSISGSFDKPVASAFSYPAGMFNAWN